VRRELGAPARAEAFHDAAHVIGLGTLETDFPDVLPFPCTLP
jgi:hypothetical protein